MDDYPQTQSEMGEPPQSPPVALAVDDEGDFIRHMGDKIAGLSRAEASSLHSYLEQVGAI